ncbi:MAG: hypothetical protein V2A77_02140, partial [Pseudomonadota bacterium]
DGAGDDGSIYFGTSDSYVVKAFTGYTHYDGDSIVSTAKWAYDHLGYPHRTKQVAGVYVPGELSGNLQVTLDMDMGRLTKTKTTGTYTSTGAFILDSSILDGPDVLQAAAEHAKWVRFLKMTGRLASIEVSRTSSGSVKVLPPIVKFLPCGWARGVR